MKFTNKDGELRLYDATGTTGPYYMTVLFTNGDINYPLGRSRPEEVLNMDRGNVDSHTSYSEGPDDPILEPLPFTLSARLDDTVNTTYLRQLLSGVTTINNKTMVTTKATSSVTVNATSAVSTPAFADSRKVTYNVEIFYDGTVDLGTKLKEVYFAPAQQTINEGENDVSINVNGMIYGPILPITGFTSGTTIQQ